MSRLSSSALRWLPLAPPLALLAAIGARTRASGFADLGFTAAAAVWALVALAVAASGAHRRFAEMLRHPTASRVALAVGFVALPATLVLLGYANRGFAVLAVALVHGCAATHRPVANLLSLAGFLAGCFALLEGALALLLWIPAFHSVPMLLPLERTLYDHQIQVVQLTPECAQYDAGLTYLLRPGHCRVDAVEFHNDYEINRLGVRDDEASLHAPEVVVVGDSFAMGWGVGQQETFPQQLERELGRTVLNTAVSSYGTVRELAILERVDRSRLQVLVIQYCSNDYGENLAYQKSGNTLPISDDRAYQAAVDENVIHRRYRLGKYTEVALEAAERGLPLGTLGSGIYLEHRGWAGSWFERVASDELGRRQADPVRRHSEVEVFLNALDHVPVDLSGVRVIAFQIPWIRSLQLEGQAQNGNGPPGNPAQTLAALRQSQAWFVDAVRAAVARGGHSQVVGRLEAIDLMPLLGDADFYPIDDHLTRSGHAKIAHARATQIRDGGR